MHVNKIGEYVIKLSLEKVPRLCRANGVYDVSEDMGITWHIDDGLGVVLLFLPV
jgi:hypothetical protein